MDAWKNIGKRLVVGIVIWVALCGRSGALASDQLSGIVSGVADGDTIVVQTVDKRRLRIRFQDIDAPEHTMAYSQVSRRHLHELVHGKIVMFDPEKLDRHGRTVAVVRLQDGTDVCLEQIKAGLAWHFKRYAPEQSPADRAAYAAAEVIAKAAKRGLWRDESPTPPCEFRARFKREEVPA